MQVIKFYKLQHPTGNSFALPSQKVGTIYQTQYNAKTMKYDMCVAQEGEAFISSIPLEIFESWVQKEWIRRLSSQELLTSI